MASPRRNSKEIARSGRPAKNNLRKSSTGVETSQKRAHTASGTRRRKNAKSRSDDLDEEARYKDNGTTQADSGSTRSATAKDREFDAQGPEDDLTEADPFYIQMPLPETWYRNVPRLFPFGETPFIEAYMSRQIDEDIRKGKEGLEPKEGKSWREAIVDIINTPFFRHSEEVRAAIWPLPAVDERELEWQRGIWESKRALSRCQREHFDDTMDETTSIGSGSRDGE